MTKDELELKIKDLEFDVKQLEHDIKEIKKENVKKKYIIAILGCDDDTIIYKDLTEYEYHIIQSLAVDIQSASTYGCMPTMEIKELKK